VNVLFSLYQNFSSNSANHVDGIARVLCAFGCDCIVAVPANPTEVQLMGQIPYKAATFEQVLSGDVHFDNNKPPEIVHFWTPREVNRRFYRQLLQKKPGFATVVHMEDNEELIAKSQLRSAYDEYAAGLKTDGFPAHLSHPHHWKTFLAEADGVTVIIDALRKFVPQGKPCELIWPSTDEQNFYPRHINPTLRAELGVKPGHIVLAYHGNVHQANFREVRSLYLAVALLNREGSPTTLLRMGKDHIELDALYRRWSAEHSINVGFVPDRARLAEILSQADVFVQPGLCDVFNEYRFPSKIPDFFALGRPVILPRTNIGLVTVHGEEAYVLDEAAGPSIADAVKAIVGDQQLRQTLAAGARRFFDQNLGWGSATLQVLDLYRKLLNQRVSFDTSQLEQLDAMNLIKRYANVQFSPLSVATVRDYCDSTESLSVLCTLNDLKDSQRPWTVKALISALKRGDAILEIGAGDPIVIALMQSLGWKAAVSDPYEGTVHGSLDSAGYAKIYPKIKFTRSQFDKTVANSMAGQLDAVYSISVLEHVRPEKMEECFAAIDTALKPGGLSLHTADAVIEGAGADFHLEQMARIHQFQNRLAGLDDGWDASLKAVTDLFASAKSDLETFYLGPQGHNLWRGSMPYQEFPFRKCTSIQFVIRKRPAT
jgi:glycosyltransferase involved in cell wall biosynthesis/2-polyprenyl-3-methyl-5-hydroxy-6-metoxy-1,4-benzoquinol methylase